MCCSASHAYLLNDDVRDAEYDDDYDIDVDNGDVDAVAGLIHAYICCPVRSLSRATVSHPICTFIVHYRCYLQYLAMLTADSQELISALCMLSATYGVTYVH